MGCEFSRNFMREKIYSMKKVWLLLFASIILQLNATAQLPYTPFPEGEAVWHVGYSQPDYSVGFRHDQYSYSGDTMMNEIKYHKLSRNTEWIPGTETLNYGIVGYLSQDTSNRKVFYRPFGDSTSYLLYDFNLHLGDLYPETYTHDVDDSTSVIRIDSIFVDNNFRRILVFKPGYLSDTLKLIEGIGANTGLLSPAFSGFCFEYCSWLSCFQVNGETQYTDLRWGYAPACNMVYVNEVDHEPMTFLLKPNPIHEGENANLSFASEIKNIEILICDELGNNLWIKSLRNRTEVELPTDHFTDGIYVVRILANNKFCFTQKLIVQ